MPMYEDTDFVLVSRANNAKHARFSITSITAGAERVFTLPDYNAILAAINNEQTFTSPQNFIEIAVDTLGIYDGSVVGSILFSVPGTGVATIIAAQTAGRSTTLPNDTGSLPTVVAPASATVDLTGKTASIAATTIYTTVHAGRYRISAYAVLTAVTTPGNLTLSAIYTDPQQAQTIAFNRNNTLAYAAVGNEVDGSLEFQATSGSLIRFSTTLTGVGTYSIYVRCEALT